MKSADDILALAKKHEAAHVALLRTLVAHTTHANDPSGLRACIEILRGPLGDLGFGHSVVDVALARPTEGAPAGQVRPHLLAERPGNGPTVLLFGHIDTVFAADHPFKTITESNGRWNGPGVADMKGGVVTALLTLSLLKELGMLPAATWRLCLVSDEEQGSPTGRAVLDRAAAGCDVALCFEAARPGGGLVISRKGLGVTRAVVQGKTGHAGIDHDQGVNAFTALCRAVVAIEDLEQRFAGLSVSAGGQVEVSPQELNVIPNEARCDLEWRFSQPGMGADMLSALERLAHELTQHTKANVSLASEIECHPMAATPESMLLYERYAKAASQLGLKVAPVATPGISDANIVAHLCPVCLDGVGPEGGNFHTDQEYLLVNTIAERAALNTVALCSLLSHAD